MSAFSSTKPGNKPAPKIFGIPLGVDPKFLVLGILAIAGLLFWYNSRGDDEESNTAQNGAARPVAPAAPVMPKSHIARVRRTTSSNDRGTLRLRPIDPTRGDVDPTLRLDLLERLQNSDEIPTGRSLFDLGPTPAQAAAMAANLHGPTIVPKNVPQSIAPAVPSGPPPLNIPLKFYGYAKPTDTRENSRGFFMDGDNVLIASEGDVLKQKYKVVELTAKTARLEDIQLRQQETLQVVPEALAQ